MNNYKFEFYLDRNPFLSSSVLKRVRKLPLLWNSFDRPNPFPGFVKQGVSQGQATQHKQLLDKTTQKKMYAFDLYIFFTLVKQNVSSIILYQ